MEWINGAPISFVSSIIKKYKKSLCEYFFGKIFYEIISGIIYIYENKLTHRDISPNNVMIEFDKKIIDGSAKLIDFGSVGFMDKYRVQSQYSRVGTSLFMAPEDSGTKSEFGPCKIAKAVLQRHNGDSFGSLASFVSGDFSKSITNICAGAGGMPGSQAISAAKRLRGTVKVVRCCVHSAPSSRRDFSWTAWIIVSTEDSVLTPKT